MSRDSGIPISLKGSYRVKPNLENASKASWGLLISSMVLIVIARRYKAAFPGMAWQVNQDLDRHPLKSTEYYMPTLIRNLGFFHRATSHYVVASVCSVWNCTDALVYLVMRQEFQGWAVGQR